jgi:peptidoglycan/LPS O-acetylase OafA/YrhL
VIAVVVPVLLLQAGISEREAEADFTFAGTIWSLAGGTVGAIGALGIIMAFNAGGKPIYVMPLVFGGAPVVNSFTEIVAKSMYHEIGPLFYAGLILVVVGAVMVLIFAPKHGPPKPGLQSGHAVGKPQGNSFLSTAGQASSGTRDEP